MKLQRLRAERLRVDLLALSAPLVALMVLHAKALQAWWTFDDPCLLAAALRHGPLAHFFRPEVWQELSGSVLMPWTPLSLSIDHSLFGLNPAGYYAHQILAFAVLLGLAYALLSRFLDPLTCSIVLTTFTLSAPAFAITRLLMNRHYLEGLILTLLALLFFLHPRSGLSAFGSLFYFLAMSAKEVFVPLIVLLPLLAPGNLKERFRRTLPYAVAAAVYTVWRFYMLGPGTLSGYAPRGGGSKLEGLLAAPQLIGLSHYLAGTLLLVLFIGAARRGREMLLLVGTATAVLALPLVPILSELWARHFFVPVFAASVLLGALLKPLPKSVKIVASVLLPLFAFTTLVSAPVWKNHEEVVEKYGVEGRFIFSSEESGDLQTELLDAAFLRCTRELRVEIADRERGPGFCGDACWCDGAWKRVDEKIVTVEEAAPAICDRTRSLSVEIDWQDGELRWDLKPSTGRWEILLVSEAGVSVPLPLAASGTAPWPLGRPLRVVLRHTTAEGLSSDTEMVEVSYDKPSVRWSRNSQI